MRDGGSVSVTGEGCEEDHEGTKVRHREIGEDKRGSFFPFRVFALSCFRDAPRGRVAIDMKKAPIIILAVVATALGIAWGGGWLAALTAPGAIPALVAQAGMWGPLVFIAVAIGCFAIFFMSGPVWASTAIWPLPTAYSYSFVAGLLASVFTYAAVRWLGQDWGQDRFW